MFFPAEYLILCPTEEGNSSFTATWVWVMGRKFKKMFISYFYLRATFRQQETSDACADSVFKKNKHLNCIKTAHHHPCNIWMISDRFKRTYTCVERKRPWYSRWSLPTHFLFFPPPQKQNKNGVFHLMFNSCETADVSHFQSICYIIRFICGSKMRGTKRFFFLMNKVVMELLSKHLRFVSLSTYNCVIHHKLSQTDW